MSETESITARSLTLQEPPLSRDQDALQGGEKVDNVSQHPPSDQGHTAGKPSFAQLVGSRPSRQHDPAFLVAFGKGEDDCLDPKEWPLSKRCRVTLVLAAIAFVASLGSSITSPAQEAMAQDFGTSTQIMIFTSSLYVAGFAFGPSMWAPISELLGRRISLAPPLFCLGLFSIGFATSRNVASLFICRFFSGFFGAAPVSNVVAALGDIYKPKPRGVAVSLYSIAVVGGPLLGPLIGAALTEYTWRWTGYLLAILSFVASGLTVVALPEVYGPVLLHRHATKLRKTTGEERWWHPHEDIRIDFKSIVTKHLARPLLMLTTEPMVTCLCLYASFVYSLVYMALQLVALVFARNYMYGSVVATLPFLGMFVGVVAVGLPLTLANQPYYFKMVDMNGGKPVPEARLPPVLGGGVLVTIGLFIFAWTGRGDQPWIAPTIGLSLLGGGFNSVFQNCLNYLVDTYGIYAASASSANTILRSILAACLPFAIEPMFDHLGSAKATSILGAFAGAFIPLPIIFIKFGPELRRRSRLTPKET